MLCCKERVHLHCPFFFVVKYCFFGEGWIDTFHCVFQTINEGLVTPVVRRKQYLKDAQANNITNNWSPSLLQKPSPPYKKLAKQTEQENSRCDGRGVTEHIFTRKLVFSHVCFEIFYLVFFLNLKFIRRWNNNRGNLLNRDLPKIDCSLGWFFIMGGFLQ